MDTYVYCFEDNIYINLTNKCSHDCVFCLRNNVSGVGGHTLWLEKEPSVGEVLEAINKLPFEEAKEVVFCGFGEPTYRLEEIKEIAQYLKSKNATVRLDTNGCGNLINKRNIVPDLKGLIDKVSISLNASDAETYQKICRTRFGTESFEAMLEFIKLCKNAKIKVLLSVVDTLEQDEIEKCRDIAHALGVDFRVRTYIT